MCVCVVCVCCVCVLCVCVLCVLCVCVVCVLCVCVVCVLCVSAYPSPNSNMNISIVSINDRCFSKHSFISWKSSRFLNILFWGLFNKFLSSMEADVSLTVLKRPHHWSISWARWIHFTALWTLWSKSVVLLLLRIRAGLQNVLTASGLETNLLNIFSYFPCTLCSPPPMHQT